MSPCAAYCCIRSGRMPSDENKTARVTGAGPGLAAAGMDALTRVPTSAKLDKSAKNQVRDRTRATASPPHPPRPHTGSVHPTGFADPSCVALHRRVPVHKSDGRKGTEPVRVSGLLVGTSRAARWTLRSRLSVAAPCSPVDRWLFKRPDEHRGRVARVSKPVSHDPARHAPPK